MSMPTKALSIRQPWASMILEGTKDVENRTWYTQYRGPVWIHSGRELAENADEAVMRYNQVTGDFFRDPDTLRKGGIIGIARISDVVKPTDECESPWYDGEYAFVLEDPVEVELVKCPGRIRFFKPGPAILDKLEEIYEGLSGETYKQEG